MAFLSSTITELTSEICRLTAEILEKPTGTLLVSSRRCHSLAEAVSRCSLPAVAAAGLLLPEGFSRDRPQPGYRSGCDQG